MANSLNPDQTITKRSFRNGLIWVYTIYKVYVSIFLR